MNDGYTTCPYCGKVILENAKVCVHCGKSLQEAPNNSSTTKTNLPIIKILSVVGIFIIIFAVITSVSNNSEDYSPKVKQLVSYATTSGKVTEAIDLWYSLSNAEKNAFIKYFDKYQYKLPPVWFFITADQVYTHDKDKAVLYFWLGKIRVLEDVLLCEDTTARNGQPTAYYKTAPKTVQYIQTKNNDTQYKINMMQKALDWDENHPERVSAIWSCAHGLRAMYEEPKLINESEFQKQREVVRDSLRSAINDLKSK